MVLRCVAQNCSNTTASGHSLHKFPKDPRRRKLWEKFVQVKRADFNKSSDRSQLCSAHFSPDCYQSPLRVKMGLATYRKLLPSAVPTIHIQQTAVRKKSQRPGRALGKLSVSRMEKEFFDQSTINQMVENACCNESRSSSPRHETGFDSNDEPCPGFPPCVKTVDCSTQTDPPKTRVTSIGCQIDSPELSQCMSTQTELGGPHWLEDFVDPINEEEDDEMKDPTFSPTKWMEMDDLTDDEDTDDETERESISVSEHTKFIVYQSELIKLFKVCPCCHENCTPTIYELGTFITITNNCDACNSMSTWSSQPKVKHQPLGNVELSAALLFSGCPISRTLRMLDFLGIAGISEQTFYKHQRDLLQPIIFQTWQNQQSTLYSRLKAKEGNLVLTGDGRSDSPGHCAKYGGYNVIEARINKVIDVQVVQSNEVPNSSWCEHEGLQRAIRNLQTNNLFIEAIITDRHPQNTAWIRKELGPLGVKHYFDIWHIAKGLAKKIDVLSKQKGCGDVGLWKKSLVNHLYYVGAKSCGCGDLSLAMWQSIANHVQDIHEGHGELYPKCDHGPLIPGERRKLWLKAGTLAGDKLADILENRYLLKDVKMLSPIYQTSGLEAFHSLILNFAPKHTAYSYQGMTCRLQLAAMHYNENSDRLQAVTIDGRPQYTLRYPKAKKGGHSISMKKTKPTFNYAKDMIRDVVSAITNGVQALLKNAAVEKKANIPEPLSSSILEKPSKEDAVQEYLEHHCRFKYV